MAKLVKMQSIKSCYDNIILYVAIAGVSLAGLVTMIVVQKRKNK